MREQSPRVNTLIGSVTREIIGLTMRYKKKSTRETIRIVFTLFTPVIEKPFKYFERRKMVVTSTAYLKISFTIL
jgi:hypothetical protein